MVCLVHDRRYLSQFHATVNKLRDTKQFSILTLQQLPKKCCSCPEKYKNSTSSKVVPLIESIDIDALKMICLKVDIERCLQHKIESTTSKLQNYAILSFKNLSDSINQISLAVEYISQRIDRVSCEFITSGTSIELLHTTIQHQYDLVKQCSNYTEVQQIVNGLWMIIKDENQMEIDALKTAVENDWNEFVERANTRVKYTEYCVRKNDYPLLTINECLFAHQSKIAQEKRLKKQNLRAIKQLQRPQATFSNAYHEQFYQSQLLFEGDSDNEEDDSVELNTRSHYLVGIHKNSKKNNRTRIHRRQNILAFQLFP